MTERIEISNLFFVTFSHVSFKNVRINKIKISKIGNALRYKIDFYCF